MNEPVPMWDLHQLVAALNSDGSELSSYARVLTESLGDSLPPAMVEVDYRKSLFGRAKQAVALTVHGRNRQLAMEQHKLGVRTEVRTVVRDVVISRKDVPIDEWLTALAEELRDLAQRNAATRDALSRLLAP